MARNNPYPRHPSPTKVYVYSVEGDLDVNCYTTLKGVAKASGLTVSSLSTGRRVFVRKGESIRIHELKLIKTVRKK